MKIKGMFKTLLMAGALAGMFAAAQAETLRFAFFFLATGVVVVVSAIVIPTSYLRLS